MTTRVEHRAREPLRIGFVVTALGRGGAETQLVRLAGALARRGHHVSVLGLGAANDFAPELADGRIGVATLGLPAGRFSLGAARALARWIAAERPTHLVGFLFHADLVARVAGRLARVPAVVSSIRNVWLGGRARDLALRATDALADAVVANSRTAADALVARGVTTARRLHVIPNALDPALARPPADHAAAARAGLGVTREAFLWLAAGRLHANKDHATLLEAFARLPEGLAPAQLAIAGEGPERSAIEARARALGVASRVHLLGQRRDLPALYAAADAVVLASRWEGLPNVLLEALACETPVVATDVGGAREVVDAGRSGLLVAPGAPAALADAMARLAARPADERARMGRHGRDDVVRRFALTAVADEWEALLAALAPPTRGRP